MVYQVIQVLHVYHIHFVQSTLYLWPTKSLAFAISYRKNMTKFLISTHMSTGKSYFPRASSNIGETNLMIRIISKTVMIKTCNND